MCAGYAATLQMLLNAVGIDTVEVTSFNHAWNMVNLYGIWYEVDATWADQSNIMYLYYNRSYDFYKNEYGNGSSHTVEDYWNSLVPEAIYDSQMSYQYESPYFESGNYTWFEVNNDPDTKGYLAAPVIAKNNASFAYAPKTVQGMNEHTYTTLYLKEKAAVPIPTAVTGLKIGGRATDVIRLNWDRNDTAEGYIIEQYKNGAWTRIARIGNSSTTTYRVEKLSAFTTYQFRVRTFNFNENVPQYSDYQYINGKTNPPAPTGVKIGGRAADALRLNWDRNANAEGYIIEQYKNGAWTRVARIGSNSTTTYRVEKLSASCTCQFRIRSFGFDGNTPLYSGWAYINGKTIPSFVSGVKIGGRAENALRLNWTKNASAEGYIIEQYKNGAWTRIARIGSNSTVTYCAEKLSASTTYQFRIQSFAFDGSTPLYSDWTYINGKTTPSAMSGVMIGGVAKDALRINWNKNTTSQGYIIEQYKNGKWTRIARIGSNSTTTYRVENLSAFTTHQFRIQAFNFEKNTPLYGVWFYVGGTTK